MATKQNAELITETAQVLLEAIKEAAPTAQGQSTDGLRSLAEAFALVAQHDTNVRSEGSRVSVPR